MIFDAKESERLKQEGMQLAAAKKKDDLSIARAYAKVFARMNGNVDADMVQRYMEIRGVDLGPAAGSIFKGKEWVHTGEYVKSSRVKNHSRLLGVWRLR